MFWSVCRLLFDKTSIGSKAAFVRLIYHVRSITNSLFSHETNKVPIKQQIKQQNNSGSKSESLIDRITVESKKSPAQCAKCRHLAGIFFERSRARYK